MVFLLIAVTAFASAVALAQRPTSNGDRKLQSTPAYAEVLLKETEIRSEIEVLAGDYTEEFPKLKELRFALAAVQREKGKLLNTPPAEIEKLTLAVGKLIVRKVDAEMDLWRLQQSLADSHPDVKRARKKVEVFENAIKEILG